MQDGGASMLMNARHPCSLTPDKYMHGIPSPTRCIGLEGRRCTSLQDTSFCDNLSQYGIVVQSFTTPVYAPVSSTRKTLSPRLQRDTVWHGAIAQYARTRDVRVRSRFGKVDKASGAFGGSTALDIPVAQLPAERAREHRVRGSSFDAGANRLPWMGDYAPGACPSLSWMLGRVGNEVRWLTLREMRALEFRVPRRTAARRRRNRDKDVRNGNKELA
ncbi:hypothetical protein K491DRAFT_680156 [Lophiostoma macrostomum CBS 122681]|uniref:Uncharacterized protein n=1 Tax=Lophiostoma macrostomum CBS 122681 TaxID=1314788 RepID=A0A6A6T1N7_9PLEO|nr:hypothetical protein K491DRAFT_680156 [Lophiostoma macrostomum CBS 122681]